MTPTPRPFLVAGQPVSTGRFAEVRCPYDGRLTGVIAEERTSVLADIAV